MYVDLYAGLLSTISVIVGVVISLAIIHAVTKSKSHEPTQSKYIVPVVTNYDCTTLLSLCNKYRCMCENVN